MAQSTSTMRWQVQHLMESVPKLLDTFKPAARICDIISSAGRIEGAPSLLLRLELNCLRG